MVKVFSMMSPLPEAVLNGLTQTVRAIDDRLQARSYKVAQAIAMDDAFDESYIESSLQRGLLCGIVPEVAAAGFTVEFFNNGGCGLRGVHDGIERRFRFRKARRDPWNDLIVRTNSDSFLTHTVRDISPTLFDEDPPPHLLTPEQWVLAYVVHPLTRTFQEISARLPVELLGAPPYRLRWGKVVPLPLVDPLPPAFPGKDDDLPMDDDIDESGEETG